MHVAIEGCLHGELDKVYATLLYIQQQRQIKIDLLICCGDFQSIRNKEDMYAMSCPEKYLTMGNFYEYYSGKKKAPILTLFIGGNHEASNYLRELHFGGWVAENIYYMGASNVIWVRKGDQQIRVGGASGIYKDYHFQKGYFEKLPLNDKAKKSIYHVREFDVYKLNFVKENLDVFVSHDWPLGIHEYGDVEKLLRIKPFFRQEVNNNTLGNPAMEFLLHKLEPKYWFSAHLHVKFPAEVHHKNSNTSTKFLALDKCLQHRDFIQVLNIGEKKATIDVEPSTDNDETQPVSLDPPVELLYDLEWLAIQKLLTSKMPIAQYETHFFSSTNGPIWKTDNTEQILEQIAQYKDTLKSQMGDLRIPLNFQITAAPFDPKQSHSFIVRDKAPLSNQTEDYLKLLDLKANTFENFLYYDQEKKPEEEKVEIRDTNDDEIDLGLDLDLVPPPPKMADIVKPIYEQSQQPSTINTNISLEELPFK